MPVITGLQTSKREYGNIVLAAQSIETDVSDSVSDGVRWLGYSGIQTASGAVADSYDVESRTYSETSTLSSGYLLDGLLKLVEMEDEVPEFLTATGEHLLNEARDAETEFFVSTASIENRGPIAKLFDCGVALQALAGLGDVTRNYRYLAAAEGCGSAFMRRMSRVDGSFFPIYDLAAREAFEIAGDWKTEATVPMLKAATAARYVYELTRNRELSELADFMVRWAMREHANFLDVDATPDEMTERLHGYCCFLEGLLPIATDDIAVMQTLQGGFLQVERRCDALAGSYHRCEVTAQLLRLRLFCDLMGIVELDYSAAEVEADSLQEFQIHSHDPRADGGFSPAKVDGSPLPIVTTRATVYATQALAMWSDQAEGVFSGDWKDLI